jgi:hypothetical protein
MRIARMHRHTPNSINAIMERTFFHHCSELWNVTLVGLGQEEIGKQAFHRCTSFQHIFIPPTIKTIKDHAFFC